MWSRERARRPSEGHLTPETSAEERGPARLGARLTGGDRPFRLCPRRSQPQRALAWADLAFARVCVANDLCPGRWRSGKVGGRDAHGRGESKNAAVAPKSGPFVTSSADVWAHCRGSD